MQNKTSKNAAGQRHGYWETYYSNGQLYFKGLYINGNMFGKHEACYPDGKLRHIINYINNKPHGYYENCGACEKDEKRYYAK